MVPSHRIFVCLLVALASGAAALAHQLLWTRRLVDILGATGEATSLVLGCFFFGLSLGSAIASRFVGRLTDPWKTLALVEIVIALLALPASVLPHVTEWIWPVLGPELLNSWLGIGVKLIVSCLVVIPPATAMGMTLPILVVAFEKTATSHRGASVLIYAFNTLGGALGLLATSAWLLDAFGVYGSMMIAILTNVTVAATAWTMRQRTSKSPKPKREKTSRTAGRPELLSLRFRLFMAGLSGCIVLALEVVSIRLLSLIVASSFQASSSVLLSVILMLGIAALLVPLLGRIIASPRWQLLAVLSLSAIGSALSPALLYHRTDQLIDVSNLAALEGRSLEGALDFQVDVLLVALVSIGPSILFAGLVFPILLSSVTSEATSSTGRQWALLLAINGVGGLSGAILAEYLVIPSLGIYGGMLAVGAVQAIAVVGMAIAFKNWVLMTPGLIASVVCLALIPRYREIPYVTPKSAFNFAVEKTLFGKDGVSLVVNSEEHGRGILQNNQYILGNTSVFDEQRRQVLIPLLLHGQTVDGEKSNDVKQVCCLGLATGMSAGAALDYDDDCHVTAVELSPTVVVIAREYFAEENRDIVTSLRATVVVEDARTYIASVRNQFDVIAGDLYRPYGSGEGRLYSLEHFRNVRSALRQGGIYCQWIPAYQVTEEHSEIIAATFLQAFEDAALLRIDSNSGYPQLGLMGTKDAEIDWGEVESRCDALRRRGVGDKSMHDIDFLKSVYVGKLSEKYFADTPLNTLDNVLLEIKAGLHRATINPRSPVGKVGRQSYLQGENWKEFSSRVDEMTVN